jgi:hypothetical protein
MEEKIKFSKVYENFKDMKPVNKPLDPVKLTNNLKTVKIADIYKDMYSKELGPTLKYLKNAKSALKYEKINNECLKNYSRK